MFDVEMPNLEYEKFICTECYELGAHGDVTYGNWIEYTIRFIIIAPLIAIPSALYFAALFVLFVIAKGKFVAIDTMDLFPLSHFLPEKPHSIKFCPSCKKVNAQAKIKDTNGQTALHFHKRNGMHMRGEKVQKVEAGEMQKPKHDPDEF